jgi:hypothetical protein
MGPYSDHGRKIENAHTGRVWDFAYTVGNTSAVISPPAMIPPFTKRRSSQAKSNSSDNDLGIFARGTIIGAQITARFLWFYPGQRPAALGARRPKIVDELEIQRVHGAYAALLPAK